MRQINWEQELSNQDVKWLQQSGILYVNGGLPLEEAIRQNREQFSEDTEDDDYDEWSKEDLESEVDKRREIAPIEVTGSGKGGNILKSDLISALRAWDQENGDTEA